MVWVTESERPATGLVISAALLLLTIIGVYFTFVFFVSSVVNAIG